MKVLIFLALLGATRATDPVFTYIHGGGDSCESTFSYHYDLNHLNKSVKVQFSVDVHVRTAGASNPNSLLFFFDNYKVIQYENADEPDAGQRDLVPFPVRVTYDEHGKIGKVEFSPKETDASYHLKKGIVTTLQLDWDHVQEALDGTGSLTFESTFKSRSIECKVTTQVHRAADTGDHFCVHATRKHTDCTSKFLPTDYDKFKDSKKVWKYHFDLTKAKNFEHLKIHIEDYFKPDVNILINAGFDFKGCEPRTSEWDTSDLEEIYKPLPIHGQEKHE